MQTHTRTHTVQRWMDRLTDARALTAAPVRLALLWCTFSEVSGESTSVWSARVAHCVCILCRGRVCRRRATSRAAVVQCSGNRRCSLLSVGAARRLRLACCCHSNVALAVLVRWQYARIPRRRPALVAKFNHLECYEAGVIPSACGPIPVLGISKPPKS